jgi:hypothetical protein
VEYGWIDHTAFFRGKVWTFVGTCRVEKETVFFTLVIFRPPYFRRILSSHKIETLAPFHNFKVVPRRNLTMYLFARPMGLCVKEEVALRPILEILLGPICPRPAKGQLNLQDWQVILSLKTMLTGEGLDSCPKLLLSECLRKPCRRNKFSCQERQ